SHTEYPTGEFHGDNVLYVQTGEYLNNIGHVEIDLADFSNSTAKLVPTFSYTVEDAALPKVLEPEKAAQDGFDAVGSESIFDDLEFILSSDRDIVRRREAALGNLITDAMMSYGQGFSQKPDLAVINGGGIRADINPPTITVGDVIAVLPFGNMYSSIEVTGQQILDMFEFSYKTESDVSEEGELVLGQAGGFLQVSGVKVIYNSAKPEGSRIEGIWFERDTGLEALDLAKSYVLATNDFLAVGGDGYTMLGGPRIEGNGLEEVFREFLEDHGDTLDWSLYEDQTPRTRLFQIEVDVETLTTLEETIVDAKALIEDSDDIPVELINVLQAAINKAEEYLLVVEDYTLEDHLLNIDAILAAMEAIEDYEAPVVPVEPTEPEDKDELPPTGISSVFNPGFALIGLGLVTTAVAKKRRKED
ncbi:MAG: bifunctional metallophosphatase/5'-nucleotidase, partial [Erysipelothrix sp.]|nr:bifunctional metallophosphatase/5'-nucleotidase [Erysipelothrix sp.]